MTAQEAAKLTDDNVTITMKIRESISAANLDYLLNVVIVEAAKETFGSLNLVSNILLKSDIQRLSKLGYNVKVKPTGSCQITWQPKAANQNWMIADIKLSQNLKSLPR